MATFFFDGDKPLNIFLKLYVAFWRSASKSRLVTEDPGGFVGAVQCPAGVDIVSAGGVVAPPTKEVGCVILLGCGEFGIDGLVFILVLL